MAPPSTRTRSVEPIAASDKPKPDNSSSHVCKQIMGNATNIMTDSSQTSLKVPAKRPNKAAQLRGRTGHEEALSEAQKAAKHRCQDDVCSALVQRIFF